MNLEHQIIHTFSKVLDEPKVTNDFIMHNQDIMELVEETDYFQYVPAYMLWCLINKDSELVDMNIVNALAEYGRSKNHENNYLNFKFRCNIEQKNTVIMFLKWCMAEISTSDKTQIERALKNWGK